MRSSGKIVMTKEYPEEVPSFCDSIWACVLNDYVEDMEETSVLTDPSEREVDHKIRRRQERKERRERRRSSSGTRTRSRSKTRGSSRSSRHRRRGSSSHSRVSTHSKNRHDESRFDEESVDSGHENTMISSREVEDIKREIEEVPIPSVPSQEMRKPVDAEDSRRRLRTIDAEMDVEEEKPAQKSPSKKGRKRPPKLTINSFGGDDAPREPTPSSSKREEAPPVLFRPIKNRYNPSPKSSSSPRVMSPMSSPRSPSNLRVDSAEFNTMEDYQKKVLAARSKRSGRKFERIQAIRAKSMSHRVDP